MSTNVNNKKTNATTTTNATTATDADKVSKCYIETYINRAVIAQKIFEKKSQEETDAAVRAIAKVVYDNAEKLAQWAVDETGMGNYPDKASKNQNKAKQIWNSLKGKKSKGIIERNAVTGITKIAKPKGIIAAITPCTNPIVTPMGNAMMALKGGNAIIITPHHKSIKCSTETVNLIRTELDQLGLPVDLVQILDEQSRDNTRNLIAMADVVVATGGASMVKAAYSSGRPALGVGAGNVQCIIDRDVDIATVVPKIIAGRTFDNGITCSAEQSIICPAEQYERILSEFEKNGAYIASDDEKDAFRAALFIDGNISRHVVGQSAQDIARLAHLTIPADAKLIVIPADGIGTEDILSKEKMCPVITAYRYDDFNEAVDIARTNLELEGKGHSVSIHSNSVEHIEYAGEALSVSRFVINQASATSAGGSFYNGLAPTNTLGCGSWGHNSISENLDYHHLMNVSRIAYFMKDNPIPTDEELWSE
ncbi:MAG: aldehyde dehydrogenase family protein [Clostridiales Family XIII bacterium]|jgi:succinate-semialdehyde dehydrogenase|nr:aldehyde dehydrogenase family protein [Clostridiales Family XIII bacterium]